MLPNPVAVSCLRLPCSVYDPKLPILPSSLYGSDASLHTLPCILFSALICHLMPTFPHCAMCDAATEVEVCLRLKYILRTFQPMIMITNFMCLNDFV